MTSSEDLHPAGYCGDNGFTLRPPKGMEESGSFDWKSYLLLTKCSPVPFRYFSQVQLRRTPQASIKDPLL